MGLKNIGILAGEASGDILGSGLINVLRSEQPQVQFVGIGGPKMIAEGCHSLYDMERLSVMGLVEPLFRLPELFRIRRGLYQYFTQHRPDVFIGIDSPDFNLGLELKLRQKNIPVIHYVSPSVWAWRQKRIHKIAKATDLVLTLFPFEADFYRKHHVPVQFVGHPLADLIPLQSDKIAARKKMGLDPETTYIAILPGSRPNEIKYLAERFLATAYQCWKKRPQIKFITSSINKKRHEELEAFYQANYSDLPLTFFEGRSHEVMECADVVLVTSGTATLETMLYKRPMVVTYRMANLTFQLAQYLVKLKFISIPNLLADERLVPEFIQSEATPENMSHALLDYLDHPEKTLELEERFMKIHQQLRCDANQQAAKAVLNLIAR